MEPLSCFADALGQARLHKAVDILVFMVDRKPSGFYILPDGTKPAQDVLLVLLRQDSLLCQHGNMCLAALYVLKKESFIKFD